MAVRASVTRFPGNLEVQERAEVAWGVSVKPFAAVDERGNQPVLCSDGHLLRCENCWAYLNALCEMEQWACPFASPY